MVKRLLSRSRVRTDPRPVLDNAVNQLSDNERFVSAFKPVPVKEFILLLLTSLLLSRIRVVSHHHQVPANDVIRLELASSDVTHERLTRDVSRLFPIFHVLRAVIDQVFDKLLMRLLLRLRETTVGYQEPLKVVN